MEREPRDPNDPRWRTTPPLWDKLKPAARSMRVAPTPAEDALWRRLRSDALGVKFRRQHAIGQFIVDFYAREAALVIEVDGDIHQAQLAQDEARDAILTKSGLLVLRFKNNEVTHDIAWVLDAISTAIEARTRK